MQDSAKVCAVYAKAVIYAKVVQQHLMKET